MPRSGREWAVTRMTSRATQVHQRLLHELRAGTRKPGAAISVREAAERYAVSPTPVREALERLVGEGMVAPSEDRNGFVVPRLGARGFVSLVETFTLLAESASASSSVRREVDASEWALPDDPALATEVVFEIAFRRSTNAVTIWTAHRLSNILAPYRMIEPEIIPSWHADLDQLARALGDGRQARAAIRAHARRQRQYAAEIVDRVERGG